MPENDVAKGIVAKALTSVIGRILLAVFAVVIVPIEPQLIHLASDVFGYNLTDAQVEAYANRAILAIAALASVWLLNHGQFARSLITKYGYLLRDDEPKMLAASPGEKDLIEIPPVLEDESHDIGDSAGRPPLTEITR